MPRAPIPNQPKRKRGCQPRKIDWNLIDKLLIQDCTGTEIAARLNIHYNTLVDRCQVDKGVIWRDYAREKFEYGNTLLRSIRFQKAMKGDNQMILHLSKHRLQEFDTSKVQMTSKQEITTIEITKPIVELPDNEHSFLQLPSATIESPGGPAV